MEALPQASSSVSLPVPTLQIKTMQIRRPGHASKIITAAFKIKKGKKGPEKEYPWPQKVSVHSKDGNLAYLSRFKPLPIKQKLVTLPFEKPLADLDRQVTEVRELAIDTGMDFTQQIDDLEARYDQVLKDLYAHLTPVQRLSVARHPNRPTCLDHVLKMTDKWVELHGDRAGYDDPAIVTGIGTIDGISFVFIGHQKGRNTKENIFRNFAMPTPHGYRKALRMMEHANHHGFPIITLIDTPGAYADVKSEEAGQGEAIAHNLRSMFTLKVPVVTVVIGEGGSGGALAIGCCNKMLMLENSVYYVASPEACAAILWKNSAAAPLAAEKLRITSQELYKFGIADEIIPEPLGGAHADPDETSRRIKQVVMKHMHELLKMGPDQVQQQRLAKFRAIGHFQEGSEIDSYKTRNMKKLEAFDSESTLKLGRCSGIEDMETHNVEDFNVRLFEVKVQTTEDTPMNVSVHI
uniref:acetyl-CoA carboxytransferase n=1 Tax=Gnetum ula TaxID=3383 RepID=A0A499U970_9SPER|nr:acetyl-CoA carboxyltransferase subunit alpha [Gnetum ula]